MLGVSVTPPLHIVSPDSYAIVSQHYTPQHSEGASYWQLMSLDRRLQRLKRYLHPCTVADPGASYEGAMAFSGGVLRELEKGFYAKILLPGEDSLTTVRNVFTCAETLSVV